MGRGRHNQAHHLAVVVEGDTTEVVQSYKYLGVHVDNKLHWSVHANAAYTKGQSRLFFSSVAEVIQCL